MFNDPAWQKVLEKSYGFHSERLHDCLFFRTRRGLEMNPVGDYYPIHDEASFSGAIPQEVFLRLDHPVSDSAFRPQFVTHRLKTTGNFEELLYESIHQKTRNLILKAEKAGLETYMGCNEKMLRQFYPLYVRSLLSRNALPQSLVLFINLLNELGEEKLRLFLTFKDGKALSGILTLFDKKNRRLHIWANGQSKDAREFSANMETHAAVLRFACENPEVDEVDFGNSEKDSSLAFFKSRFGGEEVPIYSNEPDPSEYSLARRADKLGLYTFLRLLPTPLLSPFFRFLFRFFR